MSHFAILVVGDNPEQQLAPYHEFESTERVDQYVQSVDITDEFLIQLAAEGDAEDPLLEALSYYGYENRVVESEDDVDLNGEHTYGYAVILDNEVKKVVRRTNPNSKWDWYTVGGRWTGFLKLKPNASGIVGSPGLMMERPSAGYADQATKGSVDWEGMREESAQKAANKWDAVKKLAPDFWESWDIIHERHVNVEDTRIEYYGQSGIKAIQQDRDLRWVKDDILVSREQYIQSARDEACCLFGLVKDGQWIERGEMGWFGCVDNETSPQDWCKQFSKEIDELPDDILITVVDCHI